MHATFLINKGLGHFSPRHACSKVTKGCLEQPITLCHVGTIWPMAVLSKEETLDDSVVVKPWGLWGAIQKGKWKTINRSEHPRQRDVRTTPEMFEENSSAFWMQFSKATGPWGNRNVSIQMPVSAAWTSSQCSTTTKHIVSATDPLPRNRR